MTALYQITQQFRELQRLVEESDEELDDETIANTLAGLEGDLVQKAESVARVIRNLEIFAGLCNVEHKKIELRGQRMQKRADRVRAYLLNQLLTLPEGQRRIERPEFTIAPRLNPPAVEVIEGAKVPPEYQNPPPPPPKLTPNKKKIGDVLKVREEIAELEAFMAKTPEKVKPIDTAHLAALREIEKTLPALEGCRLITSYRLDIKT